MGAKKDIQQLQRLQKQHDYKAHQDILFVSYPDRMRHYAFHVAKYAGRLSDKSRQSKEIRRTIVDSLLIALSSADVLNIDYSIALSSPVPINKKLGLTGFSKSLAQKANVDTDPPEWFFRQLASIAGRLAKSCESLDHMEAVAYREELTAATLDLCKASLIASSLLDLDIIGSVRKRWREIEKKRVL